MKNISYIINGVLAVAIIVLFILFFTSNKNSTPQTTTTLAFSEGDSTSVLPIAYVNVDTLLTHYNFYKDSFEELAAEEKKITATAEQKKRQLESEYNTFNQKLQKNAFLSQEQFDSEANRIRNLEANIQNSLQKLQADIMQKQAKMNTQIFDSIRVNLNDYNKKANYQIIFSNTGFDNILVAKDSYDITKTIVDKMNSRYKKEQAK
ncbi:OmpH family outer membrane protein [Dysgonomonas sp. Marseille-P4361]|uniref:OmpH family outer membrane protein n=1 Tax=Dysgonomonas sp. Marseille-P4361 TaxID=2161820 RepID=UPI000D55012A|nr:OmpH family outer membrane protein [Dysgonomonas sp. Marseille-P4361]